MSWTYNQTTGELRKDGILAGVGYSGCGNGKNNWELEATPNVGPIPVGWWTIEGPPKTTDKHGPYVLRLTPDRETQTYGRTNFLLHGDSLEHPGQASEGCIVAPPHVRTRVYQSGDKRLQVVSGWIPADVGGEISV